MKKDKSSNIILILLIGVLVFVIFNYDKIKEKATFNFIFDEDTGAYEWVPNPTPYKVLESDVVYSIDPLISKTPQSTSVSTIELVTPEPTKSNSDTQTQSPSITPEPTPELTFEEDNKYFYFNQLSRDQKIIYNQIAKGLSNFQKKIKLNKVKRGDMEYASFAIMMDHPEFFWTSDYTFTILNNEYVTEIEYSIPYGTQDKLERVNKEVDRIFADMSRQGIITDYDKLKYFYDWIVNNVEYGESYESQDITSVFLSKISVCAGYSKAFLYLCQKADIECVYVPGTISDGESHGWNLVKLNGNYYWVDVTWGDPVYAGESGNEINYNYFLVTDDELFKNHIISYDIGLSEYSKDKKFTYPICYDESYNYYKLNNSFFSEYSIFAVRQYFQNKFRNNIYTDIEIKFKEASQFESFLHDYLEKDNPYIYEDLKVVNPSFYGQISVDYSMIRSGNYAKITVVLERD